MPYFPERSLPCSEEPTIPQVDGDEPTTNEQREYLHFWVMIQADVS
jgi:hypothetical protein